MATPVQARAFGKSLVLHVLVMAGVWMLPAGALRQSAHPEELDVVFHPPKPPAPVPAAALPPMPAGPVVAAGPKSAPAPAVRNLPPAPAPAAPGPPALEPGLPEGPIDVPVAAAPPKPKVGTTGILAFRDQIASVAQDKTSLKLGAGARLGEAADASSAPSGHLLANGASGGSGGIDAAALSRNVGGGGGGGAGGGMAGVSVGRASSSIAGIGGGGGPRALGGGGAGDGTPGHGPGAARTDEEIQIVFDRHKASFYRLYHRELRNDPSLRGQMVLKLTIEPDGTVSHCALQSSDMKAPGLAGQVVDRVRTINFGAKDVQALTIVYPIDFLPAA